jgi:hypothetical protein
MELIVLVAQLLRAHTLLQSLGLCRSSVLVRPADIERVVPAETGESGKYVGGKDGTDDVAEVRDVVDVREGGGDEDVAFVFFGQAVSGKNTVSRLITNRSHR